VFYWAIRDHQGIFDSVTEAIIEARLKVRSRLSSEVGMFFEFGLIFSHRGLALAKPL
jgi:hypothetical protein